MLEAKRRAALLLGLSALLGLLATLLFWQRLQALEVEAAGLAEGRVLVALRPIEAFVPIEAGWLVEVPAGGRLASPALAEVVGQVLRLPVAAGEPVTAALLSPADGLAVGLRALALPAGPRLSWDPGLLAGDQVDLLAVAPEPTTPVAVLLEGVPVLAVAEEAVTLGVSLTEAQLVLHHQHHDEALYLLRRGGGGP